MATKRYLFSNEQWAVIDSSMISLEPCEYHIPKEELANLMDDGASGISAWTYELAQKSWIDIDSLLEEFARALEIHAVKDRYKIDWMNSIRSARAAAAKHRKPS